MITTGPALLEGTVGDGVVVDIGGTKIMVGLVGNGSLVEVDTFPTGPDRGSTAIVSTISDASTRLARRHGIEIDSAAVAVPGALDRRPGVVRWAANLPFSNFPLAAELGQRLGGIPVVIEHDANFGVVGEAAYGAAQGLDDVVYLTVSTGIGLGTLIRGRLVEGATGLAGEIGHVSVVPDGRPCPCGTSGCLEAYASGRAIAGLGREAVASGDSPLLASLVRDPRAVTTRHVIAAAEMGDDACEWIVDQAIRLLLMAIGMILAVADPQIVVLGGGVMSSQLVSERMIGCLATAGAGSRSAVAQLGSRSVMFGGMRFLGSGSTQQRKRAEP